MGSVITDLCSLIELQSSIIVRQAEALAQVGAQIDAENDIQEAERQYNRLVGSEKPPTNDNKEAVDELFT